MKLDLASKADISEISANSLTTWLDDRARWQNKAACSGLSALPWVSDHPDDVAVCMPICRECPVRGDCAEEALSYQAARTYAQEGVMGGTTSAQRIWLAGNSEFAHEIAAECADLKVDTDEMSDWYEQAGPESLPADDHPVSERAIAARWGVSKATWKKWRSDRGMTGATAGHIERPKRNIDAYEVVEQHLRAAAAAGQPWVKRGELLEAMIRRLPRSMIEDSGNFAARTSRSAWQSVLGGVQQSFERAGRIEVEPDPDSPTHRIIRWTGA